MFTIQANTQSFSKVYSVDIMKWNSITEKYEKARSSTPNNMKIGFNGNIITVTNKSQSNYRTIGESVETRETSYKKYIWKATDEENIHCTVALIYYDNGLESFWVYYSDIIIIYCMGN